MTTPRPPWSDPAFYEVSDWAYDNGAQPTVVPRPLLPGEIAVLHARLGTAADEDDMQDRFNRLGAVDLVALETLNQRLVDLLSTPSTFAVPGEYSQSTVANIEGVKEQIARILSQGAAPSGVRVLTPTRRRWR